MMSRDSSHAQVELKVYLWGRLSFDPTLNATALTIQFLRGYYSPQAAPHMMRCERGKHVADDDCMLG
jgi:hypothetical protein